MIREKIKFNLVSILMFVLWGLVLQMSAFLWSDVQLNQYSIRWSLVWLFCMILAGGRAWYWITKKPKSKETLATRINDLLKEYKDEIMESDMIATAPIELNGKYYGVEILREDKW